MLFYYLVLIAGRSAKENLLFTEVTEGMNSYGVTRHRHGKFSLPNINGLDLCFWVLWTQATYKWIGLMHLVDKTSVILLYNFFHIELFEKQLFV